MASGGVDDEEAVDADADLARLKRCRAGLLGEVTKRLKILQQALATEEDLSVVEEQRRRSDEAFRKFVSLHEDCIMKENDEKKKALMVHSYDSELEWKNAMDLQVAKRCNSSRPKNVENAASTRRSEG